MRPLSDKKSRRSWLTTSGPSAARAGTWLLAAALLGGGACRAPEPPREPALQASNASPPSPRPHSGESREKSKGAIAVTRMDGVVFVVSRERRWPVRDYEGLVGYLSELRNQTSHVYIFAKVDTNFDEGPRPAMRAAFGAGYSVSQVKYEVSESAVDEIVAAFRAGGGKDEPVSGQITAALDEGRPISRDRQAQAPSSSPPLPVPAARPADVPRPEPAREVARPAPPPTAPPAAIPPTTGDTYVLVVGINDYVDTSIPDLRFAESDARAVYRFFATERRSPSKAERVQGLFGRDATRAAVLRAVREQLARRATDPADTVILYFAGHGFSDGQETYLATADTHLDGLRETGVAASALRDYWKEIPCGRKVLLADACRSGALEGFRGIGGVALAPSPDEGAPGRASLVIAAAGADQLSSEDPALGQGIFTTALLNGLRGEADGDGDGAVSGAELATFLARDVSRLATALGKRQSPAIRASGETSGIRLTR